MGTVRAAQWVGTQTVAADQMSLCRSSSSKERVLCRLLVQLCWYLGLAGTGRGGGLETVSWGRSLALSILVDYLICGDCGCLEWLFLGQAARGQWESLLTPARLGADAHSLQDDIHLLGIVQVAVDLQGDGERGPRG